MATPTDIAKKNNTVDGVLPTKVAGPAATSELEDADTVFDVGVEVADTVFEGENARMDTKRGSGSRSADMAANISRAAQDFPAAGFQLFQLSSCAEVARKYRPEDKTAELSWVHSRN